MKACRVEDYKYAADWVRATADVIQK